MRSAVLSFVGCLVVSCLPLAGAEERPNIVMIMCDDMGYEGVSAYGSPSYKTPQLDRLAAGGMLFHHCYSTPICTTSRVQLMTGKYNFRNYPRFGQLATSQVTFGNILKKAGYRTAIAGKWQLGGGGDTVRAFGFDEYCLWNIQGRESRYWEPRILQNDVLRDDVADRFGPDVACDFLVDFIKKSHEQPFFVYYPMMLPHWPFVPTPDSRPGGSREKLGTYDGKNGGLEYFPDMVAYVDKLVGRIDRTLEEVGVRGNTLLLFTCDNGCATNIRSKMGSRVIKGGKASLPDNGTHVALVASWPGVIKPEQVTNALVDFTDFVPTLTEVGRTELPTGFVTDGHSFVDVLRGEGRGQREWVYCHYSRNGIPVKPGDQAKVKQALEKQAKAKEAKTMGRFARTERYKLYEDGRFYNIKNDVLEIRPIAAGKGSTAAEAARRQLQSIHDQMPPWQPFLPSK